MESIAPERPIPVLASRPARWLASLALLAVALAMTVPIYGGWVSGDAQRIFRYGFTILWGVLALGATRSERTKPYLPLLLGLFGVSLGFAFAYVAGNSSLCRSWWALEYAEGRGIQQDPHGGHPSQRRNLPFRLAFSTEPRVAGATWRKGVAEPRAWPAGHRSFAGALRVGPFRRPGRGALHSRRDPTIVGPVDPAVLGGERIHGGAVVPGHVVRRVQARARTLRGHPRHKLGILPHARDRVLGRSRGDRHAHACLAVTWAMPTA